MFEGILFVVKRLKKFRHVCNIAMLKIVPFSIGPVLRKLDPKQTAGNYFKSVSFSHIKT